MNFRGCSSQCVGALLGVSHFAPRIVFPVDFVPAPDNESGGTIVPFADADLICVGADYAIAQSNGAESSLSLFFLTISDSRRG